MGARKLDTLQEIMSRTTNRQEKFEETKVQSLAGAVFKVGLTNETLL